MVVGARTGQHRQAGLVGGVIDHHLVRVDRSCFDGQPLLQYLQRRAEGLGHRRGHHCGNVLACLCPTESQLQFAAVPEIHRQVSTELGADLGLHLGQGRVAGNRRCALAAPGQREARLGRGGVNHHTLDFAGHRPALRQIAGLDQREVQVTEMRRDVGHIDMGQCAGKCQLECDPVAHAAARIDRHRDVASTDAGQAFERGLDVRRQRGAVGRVRDRRRHGAGQRDREVAAGCGRRHPELGHLERCHILAGQTATKLHQVGALRVQAHRHAARTAQRGVELGGKLGCSGPERDRAGAVGRSALGQRELHTAAGGAVTIDEDALDFVDRGRTALHQAVLELACVVAEGLVRNVLLVERADETHDIALAADIGRVIANADVVG